MTTQELTFQYWQDAQGSWQWQLHSHEQLPVHAEDSEAHPDNACHRIVAVGISCPTEEQALAEIELVKGSCGASTIKAPPAQLSFVAGSNGEFRLQAS